MKRLACMGLAAIFAVFCCGCAAAPDSGGQSAPGADGNQETGYLALDKNHDLVFSWDECEILPREQARPFALSGELQQKAREMPAATNQALPAWHGVQLVNQCGADRLPAAGVSQMYAEQDLIDISGMGFNFSRIELDWRILFGQEDSGQVNMTQLENLDRLIQWGIEYGVHICLDLHWLPGGDVSEGEDRTLAFEPAQQENLFLFWDFLAARYAGVPAGALSFNLYNEPQDGWEEENYTALMRRTAENIKRYSPERVIFVDMLYNLPMDSLADAGVCQAFHNYWPHAFTSPQNPWQMRWPEADTQAAINGFMWNYEASGHQGSEFFTINGDFAAGDTVTLTMELVGHAVGAGPLRLVVLADGQEIARAEYSDDMDTVVSKEDDGQDVTLHLEHERVRAALPAAAKQIVIRPEGDMTACFIRKTEVSTGGRVLALRASDELGSEQPPTVVRISGDGYVINENELAQYAKTTGESFDAVFAPYAEFSQRTGVPVMLQEFGVSSKVTYEAAVQYIDEFLTKVNEYDMSWCWYDYNGDFGLVYAGREYKRDGADYEVLHDQVMVPKAMLAVVQKHMG